MKEIMDAYGDLALGAISAALFLALIIALFCDGGLLSEVVTQNVFRYM